MVRELLEPPSADPNKPPATLESSEAEAEPAAADDAGSDNSTDSDLCLYSAWGQHADHLFEVAPVAEPRCYLSAGSQEPQLDGAPPQACVYTTTSRTPPPRLSAAEPQVANGHQHLYATTTDTSTSGSSSSLSSANSKSPLNRNSGRPATGAGEFWVSSAARRVWQPVTNWRRRQASALRLKMLLKRRSLLVALTCLLLISCTIASLAISRQVSQRRLTERQAADPQHTPLHVSGSPDELELRSLELVDLIECGKTFAAIKTRIEAQVARSTPVHHQRPSFLNQSPKSATSQQEVNSASQANFMLVETKSNQDGQDEVVGLESQEHLRGVEELKAQLDSTRDDQHALLAQAYTPVARMLAPDADAPDPVEEARKAMHLEHANSYNRTILECFFVDTEKRFEQRVALEDQYRLVASTRSVPLKHMMAALIECRNIDWKKAPSSIVAPTPAATEPQQSATSGPAKLSKTTTAAAQQEPHASHRQQLDFISSVVASILRNQPPTNSEQLKLGATGDENTDNRRASYSSMGLSMVSGIVPNTLWCGLGDRAANYSQLGPEYRVDSCCRAHDHCPIRLKPLTGDYGLFNWSVSTRSHCDCDQDFNQCLRQINSTLASLIRTLYFRLVGTHCIAVNYGNLSN